MIRPPPRSSLFPYTTLFQSVVLELPGDVVLRGDRLLVATGRRPRVRDLGLETVGLDPAQVARGVPVDARMAAGRSEEHTSELQSRQYLVCRLLLEKKKQHSH